MNAKSTGAFIAALRRERSLTQKQLAEAIAVTDKAVSRWETGKGYPDVETLTRLADVLGVTVGELLAGKRSDGTQDEDDAPSADVSRSPDGVKASSARDPAPPVSIYGVPPQIVGELYQKIVIAERKAQRWKTTMTVIIALIVGVWGSVSLMLFIWGVLNPVISVDKNCVIAEDYSYISCYGKKYVPVELTHSVSYDEIIVHFPLVQGQSGWERLFSGDGALFSVVGVPDRELVYLSSDNVQSKVYCLESEVERITEYDREANLVDYGIYGADRIDPRVGRICEAVEALNEKGYVRSFRTISSSSLPVFAQDERYIFKDDVGFLVRAKGEYYFEPLDNGRPVFEGGERRMIPLSDSLDADLDGIFKELERHLD